MANSQRVDWLDYQKGALLLLVCLAHCGVANICGAFRMPAFFFISGLLYNSSKYPSMKQYFSKKTNSLLLPYFYLSYLFLFFFLPIYDSSYVYSTPNIVEKLFLFVNNDYIQSIISKFSIFSLDIIMGESEPNTFSLWFVYSLFLISCTFSVLVRLCKNTKHSRATIALFSTLCFITGWLFSKYNIRIPFKLDTTITGLAFYGMGYLSRDFLLNKINSYSHYKSISLFILSFVLFIYGSIHITGNFGYIHNRLGNYLFPYLLGSVFGTWFSTFFFFLFHNHLHLLGSILKYISTNGMIILAVHSFVVTSCKYLLKGHVNEDLYPYAVLAIMICIVWAVTPFFNKYLYWAIGKNKK